MMTLIKAGGLFNIALVIFHLLFWRLFGWHDDLRKLTTINRAIMPVLNLSLVFVFVMFAWLSLVHTFELQHTTLGRSVLLSISVFFFLRGLWQVIYFRLLHWVSYAFLVFFLTGGVLYGIPALAAWNT